MKSVSYVHTQSHPTLPRGWTIVGLAIVAWGGVFVGGSGLIHLFQFVSSAV